MFSPFASHRPLPFPVCFAILLCGIGWWSSFTSPGRAAELVPPARILTVEGTVEVSHRNNPTWSPARTNQSLAFGSRVRTLENSRATVQLADTSVQRLGALTVLTIEEPSRDIEQGKPLLRLDAGRLFFKSWARPQQQEFRTPLASGAIRGTEFQLAVAADGHTVLELFDGAVDLANTAGTVTLNSGEQGIVEPGQAPRKTPLLKTASQLQWYLHYPGVLAVEELALTDAEQAALATSLTAYRRGDLGRALVAYPAGRTPASPGERLYHAGLLLSVGEVAATEATLTSLRTASPADLRLTQLAGALDRLIHAVQFRTDPRPARSAELASELVADSYYLQSQFRLDDALRAARAAVQRAPQFGFAHARLAEMEFSFGRLKEAQAALQTALQLSPDHAQAITLNAFILAAQGRRSAAQLEFERAIAVDGALANGWLGRGLLSIRAGRTDDGLRDLRVAASLEPNRSLLRSYLGKALAVMGDTRRATNELALARLLDQADPTPWLYSALVNQEQNRINEAVRDLERSIALNGNRAVYRSRLLLDQDQAVRGANLASLYDDARMPDQAVSVAARAVATDYANASAHLFLANSYDRLRDPAQINVRYDTPALSEYLISALLAPVGFGSLSPKVSQQEYSRLFDRDRVGVVSETEYTSRGDVAQHGVQYGVYGNTAYSVEGRYRLQNGWRPNNDREFHQLSLELKHDFDAKNSLYAWVFTFDAAGGDLLPRRDPATADLSYRFVEKKDPNVILGYHSEWSPDHHSLALFGRLTDRTDTSAAELFPLTYVRSAGVSYALSAEPAQNFISQAEQHTYLGEFQHLARSGKHTLVIGAKGQAGNFGNRTGFESSSLLLTPFPYVADQEVNAAFQRVTGYLYDSLQLTERLTLIAGGAIDYLRLPENFRFAPMSEHCESHLTFLPKAGLVWEPWANGLVRLAFARNRTGADLEGPFTLEPPSIAGLVQSYRSVIPDALSGGSSGALVDVIGLDWDQKLADSLYLRLAAQVLHSEVTRSRGTFETDTILNFPPDPALLTQLREHVHFRERNLAASLNKLFGNSAAISAGFQYINGRYRAGFPELDGTVAFQDVYNGTDSSLESSSSLRRAFARLATFHPTGFFADFEGDWYQQAANRMATAESWQLNAHIGYRALRRRIEARVGIMNLLDDQTFFGPFPQPSTFPLRRTVTLRLRLSF